MDEVALQRCSSCGEVYPLTPEHWHRDKSKPSGFRTICKDCASERVRKYQEANAEKVREYQCEYREANAEKVRERDRKYREANADKLRERNREYYQANAEKVREYQREYYQANAEKERERHRKYKQANAEKVRINSQRRRARKRSLPDTYTAGDWEYALTSFNGCCAVCGRQLSDLFGEHTAAMDRWIPLSSDDCTGTVPGSIVPLCHGVGGCNNSKGDKDAEEWLVETFGRRKGQQIMARIQVYFDSLS